MPASSGEKCILNSHCYAVEHRLVQNIDEQRLSADRGQDGHGKRVKPFGEFVLDDVLAGPCAEQKYKNPGENGEIIRTVKPLRHPAEHPEEIDPRIRGLYDNCADNDQGDAQNRHQNRMDFVPRLAGEPVKHHAETEKVEYAEKDGHVHQHGDERNHKRHGDYFNPAL